MREREREVLLVGSQARHTDPLPSRLAFPFDFIQALCHVALEQEKRVEDLEALVRGGVPKRLERRST